jgi:hypothetical protein
MSKEKKCTLEVQGTAVSILSGTEGDFISLTDMLRAKDGEFFISDWLRNRNTVEFLGIWESVFNPGFNYGEFAIIKSQAGLNSYKISVKELVEKTNAIGLKATAGRYGGTYAHPDIAFEFGMWISPEFKIYLVKEFRRLKDEENDRLKLGWNLQRTLAKINYRIHTDAIKDKGQFAPVEIVTGPRTDDSYPVLSGLSEGDKVVTRGNFLLDSQFQIRGLPSLFYKEGQAVAAGHQHGGTTPPPGGASPAPPASGAKPQSHDQHKP